MQTEVILAVGKRGTGKTWWARNFVKDKTRVLVADAGFEEFPFHESRSFTELCSILSRGFFRVSYTPLEWEWPHLLNAAMAAGRDGGPVWLVLEEASRLPPPRSCREYERLLIQGRHYNVNLLALSTRPAHLPPDYRSQATRVIAFRQHEERDLDYLSGIIGREKAETLPHLKIYPEGYSDHVEWTDKGGFNVERSGGASGDRAPSSENDGDGNEDREERGGSSGIRPSNPADDQQPGGGSSIAP